MVCLDSDSDSGQSVEWRRLKPCSASQHANLLEKFVEKDDEADHPLPIQQSLLDHDGPVETPRRNSSIDRGCTLDPFGSGRFNSPIRDIPTISSTSKRPASSLRAGDEVVCSSRKGRQSECISDDLGFTSPNSEPENSSLDLPETTDVNIDTNFSTLRARSLNSQLREVEDEQEAQAGGIRKKRKVTSRVPISEEDKAIERNEKLRAKEAERLRKAEEKAEMKRLKDEEKKKLQEENRRKREVSNVHTFAETPGRVFCFCSAPFWASLRG